jgi:hypothetical protein
MPGMAISLGREHNGRRWGVADTIKGPRCLLYLVCLPQ